MFPENNVIAPPSGTLDTQLIVLLGCYEIETAEHIVLEVSLDLVMQ